MTKYDRTRKKTVLVIFGGASPEHEVSCSSAAGIIRNVDKERYRLMTIGVTKDGEWIFTEANAEEIGDSISWLSHESNKKAAISTNRSDHGIFVFEPDGVFHKERVDVIFPIIHGENGEDGTLQGIFEIAGIPYIGAGVCASACSMDKIVTRIFADKENLLQPRCYIADAMELSKKKEAIVDDVERYMSTTYPMIVKPSMTGSSIGISKVNNRQELYNAIALAAKYRGGIMVEEYISGKEIKVAVLEDGEIKTGALCEITVQQGCFNDYNLKYKGTGSHKKIPAELSAETEDKIKDAAVRIFKALGCKDYSRVDFFVTKENQVYFNEINTIPGLSEKSIFSLMFDQIGLPYAKLINRMIENKLEETVMY